MYDLGVVSPFVVEKRIGRISGWC